MSSASGGRADKLGNRYEGLWVAYNLIRLLAEEIRAVQVEAIGDDEHGVDLWVTNTDGNREAQQCKRKNRTVDKWSISELARRGVLTHLAYQLSRAQTTIFTFVSSHPATELRELADAARTAGGDPESFFAETRGTADHPTNLAKFCDSLAMNAQTLDGRRQAFDLLRRTFIHSFEDSREGRAMICSFARCRVTGNAESVIENLANFAQDHMGTLITADMVRQLLRDRGFGLTNLAGDRNVAERLERLREEFRDSLQPGLINSALVPRIEAHRIFDFISNPDSSRLIILHGRAGDGKSCVLLQLIDRLAKENVPYLPIRLDRRPPRTSAQRFGIDVCDLPESPAVVLHSFYSGQKAVLLLDQLDAVRWTTSHASAQWEACQETIDEALWVSNLVVVVTCRTFDLRDDQQISTWRKRRNGSEVVVGELPESAIVEAVQTVGGRYDELTDKQKLLLRSPLHLSLWTQIVKAGELLPSWNSHADLMRTFWKSRYEAISRLGVSIEDCRAAIDLMVSEMDRRGELTIPARKLDPFARVSSALMSFHLVVESGGRINFAHQSYFEYLLATRLLDQTADRGQTIAEWVCSGDQTLMRRDQLRLVLTLLREERDTEYIKTLRQLVSAPRGAVRFHLRQLVLRLLGEFPAPTEPERNLVFELVQTGDLRDHVFDQVFTRQPLWFEAMSDRSLLDSWLSSSDSQLIEFAIRFCRCWSHRCGDQVAALLRPYVVRPEPWPERIATALPYDSAEDTDELFLMRLQLLRAGIGNPRFLVDQKLVDRHPARVIDILEALFDYRSNTPSVSEPALREGRDSPYYILRYNAVHLGQVVETLPEAVWSRLVPRIIQVCEANIDETKTGDISAFMRDKVWPDFQVLHGYGEHVELPVLVARAGAIVANNSAASFGHNSEHILGHRASTIQKMIGLALADADCSVADLAIGWLCEVPCRLSLRDEQGHEFGIGQRIIHRHAAACSDQAYIHLEATILAYHIFEERRSFKWKTRSTREGYQLEPNLYGLSQHALLPFLPKERLSKTARSMIGVLERKFRHPASDFRHESTIQSCELKAPIPSDRVDRISDAGWLEIIRGAARMKDQGQRRTVSTKGLIRQSARDYAEQLGNQARKQPQRFARLALSIPAEADLEYLSAVLYGISQLSPPTPDVADWTPASDDQVMALVEKIGFCSKGEIGRALCLLVRQRDDVLAAPACLEMLCRYATDHPDPAPDHPVVYRGDGNIEFDSAAINCTRGIALGIVQHLLYNRPFLFETFQEAVRQAVADPSPVVRVAAAGVCLPILKIDRELAVEMFLSAVAEDERILTTHNVNEFIRNAQWSHYTRLESLLTRMARSDLPAVASLGAVWITIGWLGEKTHRSAVDSYLVGSPAQRLGVAKAAAHNCHDARVAERCAALLSELINDADASVQKAVNEFLRGDRVFRIPVLRELAVQYAAGPGFAAHPMWLVEALRRHPDSLVALVPAMSIVCSRLATDLVRAARDRGGRIGFEFDQFVPLLLRLYEQAEQARDLSLRGDCLNWFDDLLEARIGVAVELLVKLDRGMNAEG